MIAHAGTAPWLLQHELRLAWRLMTTHISSKWLIGCFVGLFAMMHLIGVPLGLAMSEMPPLPQEALYPLVTLGLVCGFIMMVSTGLVAAVQTIYAHGDADLLLSSPVPARSIVLTRAASLTASMIALIAFLTLPFVNMLAVLGDPRFLVLYPVILSVGLLSCGISLSVAHGLFRLVGPRHTRLFAQVFGGLIGFLFVLAMQVPNMLPGDLGRTMGTFWASIAANIPDPESPIWLPARAAMGEPLLLLAFITLCVGGFALIVLSLSERLVADMVAASAGRTSTVVRNSRSRRFGGSPISVLRHKELLLILRDPWLLSKIAGQALFLVPLIVVAYNGVSVTGSLPWLLVVLLAGNFAAAFTWIAVSAEDAPDLLASAPLRPFDIVRAKVEAAMLIVVAALALPIAIAWYSDAWLGLTLLVCSAAGATSSALIQVWSPAPGKRNNFNQRAQNNVLALVAETIVTYGWAAAGYFMLNKSPWVFLAAALLIATMGLYRLRRR